MVMLEPSSIMLDVSDIGCCARKALASASVGRVEAVYARGFYIDLAGRWLFLAASPVPGPLTATFRPTMPRGDGVCDRIEVGDAVHVDAAGIRVDRKFLFATGAARTWSPPPSPLWTKKSLMRGLRGLDHVAREALPGGGIGVFILGLDTSISAPREARAAVQAVAELGAWLATAFTTKDLECPPISLGSLIGLGPGLTPSGDDFLGGVLIAAHALERPWVAERLYAAIAPRLADLTNPISGAHLAAAANGFGNATLHVVLNDILAGRTDRLPGNLADLVAIGHTSGWDALAGIALALRARLSNIQGRSGPGFPQLRPG
ncbi:MAG: DUF2877 domain-containing protein [Acidimicrobiia bacterium]|nr:DUF2877 domain-containing protein [Acidimicrobiia bacterium]